MPLSKNKCTRKPIASSPKQEIKVNDDKGWYYFLPRDVNPKRLKSTAVAYHDIKDTMSFANDLSSAENGVVVFTSSTGTQESMEDHRWQNGAFTEARRLKQSPTLQDSPRV
ncbi:MAG: hypothetical protein ABFS56_05895 [Pseudomonadota bacterium]